MPEKFPLSTPLTIGILKTNKPRIAKLGMMGIATVRDLLEFFPRAHEDTTEVTPVFQLIPDEMQTVRAKIISIKNERSPRRGMQLTKALISDETGQVECVWFKQGHLATMFKAGDEVLVAGKTKEMFGGVMFSSPKMEKVGMQKHVGRISGIYSVSEPITSQWLREKIDLVLGSADKMKEWLPEKILDEEDLISRSEAVKQIHQPESQEALEAAKKRLSFEELFLIQVGSLQRKLMWQKAGKKNGKVVKLKPEIVKEWLGSFPFKPTDAQKISIFEILKDMEKGWPMSRLLQGDVGSGKTLVALTAVLKVVLGGFQSVILAPTEVLAKQHWKTIQKDLVNNEVVQKIMGRKMEAALLIGSLKEKEKTEIKLKLAKGELDLVVGTHALLTDDFEIKNLGLAVIDEQHRFGVKQRAVLKKHKWPHVLTMTATPIPRTLALTLFGDQDLSLINEMPKGRKEVTTRIVPKGKREQAWEFARSEVLKGNRVFVVAPLVEESERLEVRNATQEFERWVKRFSKEEVGLLHGRMKTGEKDEVMRQFQEGEKKVLVATSVVEVGVDVPEATLMWIEGAERFGLAQLHQFRGRVGRSDRQSFCLLFSSDGDATKRLTAMTRTNDGFVLAETDLEIRGPGEVFGLKQAGIPDLKMANFMDRVMVKKAREAALGILEEDLSLEKWPLLKVRVEEAGDEF